MTVFWALNPPIGKVALAHFPPMLLIAIRTGIAAILILAVFLARPEQRKPIRAGDWPRLLFLTLGLQIGNQVLFVNGLSRTSIAHAAFLYALVPIVVLLMAAAAGQEKVRAKKLLGMAIAIAGVMLLASERGGGSAAPTLAGDALAFCAVACFSGFTVLGKSERARYGSLTLTTLAYVSGALALQPVIWGWYGDFALLEVPWQGWAALLYMAIFPAVIGYLIYFWALGHAPASKIAAVQYIQPPLATVFGSLVLGEGVSS
ncbi:MAG: DMT family transporter, partial [Acidobacteria bacterium]|nr:DMT family transporter [Acidobacteriota bacterium]